MLFVFTLDKGIKSNATRGSWCETWCDAKPIPTWPEIADNATAIHSKETYRRDQTNENRTTWSSLVLERFLANSCQLLFVNICYWPCFSPKIIFEACPIQRSISQRLEIQYLHPNQILMRCIRRRKREIPSAAIAWGKAAYDVLFAQFSSPMLIS